MALHLGTLVGAVAYFRHDIVRLTKAAVTRPRSSDGRLGWLVAISSVPAAVTGALFADTIEENTDQLWLIAVMLIAGALLLALADGVPGQAHHRRGGPGGRRWPWAPGRRWRCSRACPARG